MKIAALDIGGTMIKSAVWEEGQLGPITETPTLAKRGGEHVLTTAITLLEEMRPFERIGISTAGQVDSQLGMIRYANENIPGYTGMQIKDRLEELFSVPVVVQNDVNAAALGESWQGAGVGEKDFLCLTYGTGIGGAIVVNGAIYTGSSFSAGEFGSIITHAEDRCKGDEMSGCYERYASTNALVKKVKTYDPSLENGRMIFERIHEPTIQALIEEWLLEVTYGLVNVIHIFNPSCIVLGGGIFGQTYVIEKLREMIYTDIMPSFAHVQLKPAELGNTAGLLGAIRMALKE
ncbi:MAG: ROK family protein [Cellulosilyticaceae bacterium]